MELSQIIPEILIRKFIAFIVQVIEKFQLHITPGTDHFLGIIKQNKHVINKCLGHTDRLCLFINIVEIDLVIGVISPLDIGRLLDLTVQSQTTGDLPDIVHLVVNFIFHHDQKILVHGLRLSRNHPECVDVKHHR